MNTDNTYNNYNNKVEKHVYISDILNCISLELHD